MKMKIETYFLREIGVQMDNTGIEKIDHPTDHTDNTDVFELKRKVRSGYHLPSTKELETELKRVNERKRFRVTLRSTIFTLITVAAVAILIAVLFLPVLRIYGTSMHPILSEGDIVLSMKQSDVKTGDIIAFYYNNKILVKRVIANPGDWVDIGKDGTVYVNNEKLDEPYLIEEKAFGECNINLPYQVPESRIFVMGDNRAVSIDSRNTSVGCVADEQIVGKIVFDLWPMTRFGPVK